MCMACEQEFMYQAYLDYLARKAVTEASALTHEEQALLKASGFVCDPVPEDGAAKPGNAYSQLRSKAS